MSEYEDAMKAIRANLGPEWDEAVSSTLNTTEIMIRHGHKDCAERPAFLVNFYRGLLTTAGTFDKLGVNLFSAVAAALLFKLEAAGEITTQELGRHSYALQMAYAEVFATTPKELADIHRNGASGIRSLVVENGSFDVISGLFKRKSKPEDN